MDRRADMAEVEAEYEVRIVGRKEPLGFDRPGDARLFCQELRRMGAKAAYRKVR